MEDNYRFGFPPYGYYKYDNYYRADEVKFKMTNKIFFKIARRSLLFSFNYIYDLIDEDEDGKIDIRELDMLYKKFQRLMRKVRKRYY